MKIFARTPPGLVAVTALFLFSGVAGAADKPAEVRYTLDNAHSSVEFEVRHLGISKVRGKFGEFEADFSFDKSDFSKSKGKATIKTQSIDTGLAPRDKHLRSADFFDVAKFPAATFESRKVMTTGSNTFQMTGPLTIHGVTKDVTFSAEFIGAAKGMDGRPRLGFDASTKIDRFDFGLTWNNLVEAVPAVGREVQIILHIEAVPADEEK